MLHGQINSNINNIYEIGSYNASNARTSFDIASIYPNLVNNLTVDNFLVTVDSMSASAAFNNDNDANNWHPSVSATVSLTYQNGILTVVHGVTNSGTKNAYRISTSGKVYAVLNL